MKIYVYSTIGVVLNKVCKYDGCRENWGIKTISDLLMKFVKKYKRLMTPCIMAGNEYFEVF